MLRRRQPEHYDYPILSVYDDIISPEQYLMLLDNISFDAESSIIYIHIPFCADQCIFCNYYKTSRFNKNLIDDYFHSLELEIKHYSLFVGNRVIINGIHFGGGTPSVIPAIYYRKLLKVIQNTFSLSENAVISFEGNINSLLKENYIADLKCLGINRISFGIQTFFQEIRSLYGLKGNRDTIYRLCSILDDVGLHNYSADIMFNFPNQSVSIADEDIHQAFELGIKAVDLYSLIVYPETRMYYNLIKENLWGVYSESNHCNKYEAVFKKWYNNKGYKFTMSNTISCDTMSENIILSTQLGNNKPISGNVFGIGASSRGYISGIKYKNYVDINSYIDSTIKNSFGTQLARKLSKLEILSRQFVMAPNFMEINSHFMDPKRKECLDLLVIENVLIFANSVYHFVPGMNFWAGNVSALLMDPDEIARMKKTVLKNRKNHLNMYNQDKMQIVPEN